MAEIRAFVADSAVRETVLWAGVLAGKAVDPIVDLLDFSAVASKKV